MHLTCIEDYSSVEGIDVEQLVLELKILGNYESDDQLNTVKSRIESIFGKSMFVSKKRTR